MGKLRLYADRIKREIKTRGIKYGAGNNGRQSVRFTPISPYETPGAIGAICESFNRAVDSCVVDPLVLIPIFINDFLCIHPFNDGIGRMSRLMTTLLLYRCGYVVGRYIGIESKFEKTKLKYRDVLEQSGREWHDEKNDATPFIKYTLGIVLSAYRDFESRVNPMDEKLPVPEQVRNAIGEKIGRFTKSEIMKLVPSIGKASVENALKKLTDEGVIDRRGNGKATF